MICFVIESMFAIELHFTFPFISYHVNQESHWNVPGSASIIYELITELKDTKIKKLWIWFGNYQRNIIDVYKRTQIQTFINTKEIKYKRNTFKLGRFKKITIVK